MFTDVSDFDPISPSCNFHATYQYCSSGIHHLKMVPERVGPRPLQQVADLALVVPHPELDVLDVGLAAAEAVLVVEVGGRLEVGHPQDLLLLVAAALL